MRRLLLDEVLIRREEFLLEANANANAPMVELTYGGYTPLTRSRSTAGMSSGGSNGLNIVAAILVTASSMMVLLALRLWICRCSWWWSCWWSSPSDSTSSPGEDDPRAYDGSSNLTKKNGLGKDVINEFALVDFKALSSSKYDKVCTVCLCEFSSKDSQIRLLPGCNHSFHPPCIDMWLFSHSSCPICRKSMIPPPIERLKGNPSQDQQQQQPGV